MGILEKKCTFEVQLADQPLSLNNIQIHNQSNYLHVDSFLQNKQSTYNQLEKKPIKSHRF